MKLSFGMVGGGGISQSHIIGATFEELAELKAGCFSRDIEKNLNFGQSYHLEKSRIYSDYKTMADAEAKREDKLDFVVVATPNVSHFEICKAFLQKGIGVVCDKPLTVTVKEAEELERLAEENHLPCAVTYTFGGYPFLHLMKELYEAGEIGKAYFVSLKYYRGARLAEIFANDIKTWRFTEAVSGQGGTIADLGTHADYIGRLVMDSDVKRVAAKLIKKPGNVQLDTTGTVMLEYANGVDGIITVAQAACGHDNDIEMEILGEKGSIYWCFNRFGELKVDYLDGRSAVYRDPGAKFPAVRKFDHFKAVNYNAPIMGFINIYTGFVKTILAAKNGENTKYFYPTLSDGAKGVKFVEACVKSQKNGSGWINL